VFAPSKSDPGVSHSAHNNPPPYPRDDSPQSPRNGPRFCFLFWAFHTLITGLHVRLGQLILCNLRQTCLFKSSPRDSAEQQSAATLRHFSFSLFFFFFFLVGNLLRLQFEMIGRIVLEIQQYQSIGYPNAVDPLIRSQIQSWKVRLLFRWLCVLLVVQL
jgi:hypothetical protein